MSQFIDTTYEVSPPQSSVESPKKSKLPVLAKYASPAKPASKVATTGASSATTVGGDSNEANSNSSVASVSTSSSSSTTSIPPRVPKPTSATAAASNPKRSTWTNGTISAPAASKPRLSLASSLTKPLKSNVSTSTSSVAPISASSPSPSPSSSPSPSPPAAGGPQSASARHAAYLASLSAARKEKLSEDRRKKPGVKDRLSSTFTLSQQQHKLTGGAQPVMDRVAREKEAEIQQKMPYVFSMLGGNSVDVVRDAILERGYVLNPNEYSTLWSLQWSIIGRVINYSLLQPQQVVNHFQRAHCITSKSGLCKNIHSVRLSDCNPHDIFPKCFPVHVHDQNDLQDFRNELRINYALNIVGRFCKTFERERNGGQSSSSTTSSSDEAMLQQSLSDFPLHTVHAIFIALQAHLRNLNWIMDGLDNAYLIPPPAAPITTSSTAVKNPQATLEHDANNGGLASKNWCILTEMEWAMVVQLAEQFELQEKELFEAREKERKEKEGVNHQEAKSNAHPAAAASDDGELESKEQEQEEAEETLDEEETTEKTVSEELYQEEDSNATSEAEQKQNSEEEVDETSLDNLNMFARAPLFSVEQYYDYFQALLSKLRVSDPQYFSLSSPICHNLWIIKPGGLSRGRGIQVVNNFDAIMKILKTGGKWVLQKYIERPLVIYRKKFDVRQWVLISNFQNVYSIYFYSDNCYFRFSSEDYNPFNFDMMIHLTNNSIQKYSENFDSLDFAKGNMWSSKEFIMYLEQMRSQGQLPARLSKPADVSSSSSAATTGTEWTSGEQIWRECIQSRMKYIAKTAMSCSHEAIDLRPNSFTLFGLDFMLSDDLNPWLIEVNSSPTLVGIAVPGLVEQMTQDLMNIVTKDPWSPLSEEYREKIRVEKQRLAEVAAAAAAEEEKKDKDNNAKTTTTGAAAKKPEVKRTLSRGASVGGSASAASAAASSTAPTPASSTTADPFILPTPHPIGRRVGGFELIECSFIGVIPKSHRQAAVSEAAVAVSKEEKKKEKPKEKGATADKEKTSNAAAPGLYVTGKSVINPKLSAAAASSSVAASRRSTLPTGSSISSALAASKVKPSK